MKAAHRAAFCCASQTVDSLPPSGIGSRLVDEFLSDRETLRALCPSDSGSPDTDVAIAKNLLANPKLYKELIRKGTINLAGR